MKNPAAPAPTCAARRWSRTSAIIGRTSSSSSPGSTAAATAQRRETNSAGSPARTRAASSPSPASPSPAGWYSRACARAGPVADAGTPSLTPTTSNHGPGSPVAGRMRRPSASPPRTCRAKLRLTATCRPPAPVSPAANARPASTGTSNSGTTPIRPTPTSRNTFSPSISIQRAARHPEGRPGTSRPSRPVRPRAAWRSRPADPAAGRPPPRGEGQARRRSSRGVRRGGRTRLVCVIAGRRIRIRCSARHDLGPPRRSSPQDAALRRCSGRPESHRGA